MIRNHLLQVPVSRRHEPHVHFLCLCVAEALEFTLLESAQELRLQLERNIAHLVQKQRPLVGKLETADLLGDGARKGASLMSKKLALEQPGRYGRAIQLDEGTVLAAAVVMDGARHQLLTCPRFSQDENG